MGWARNWECSMPSIGRREGSIGGYDIVAKAMAEMGMEQQM